MYCKKCGKEIADEAVVCIGCGCSVKESEPAKATQLDSPKESDSTANCALLFAFLMPIVGLIIGIVGACKYKTPAYKQRCISAIVLSVVVWIVCFAIIAAMAAM